MMSLRLFLSAVTIFALLFQSRIAAQQRWTDRNGFTYEVYDVYPQGYYPQQQHQQQQQQYVPQYSQQQYYPQQQTPSVSVAEAEWVCTNSRTKDMMIIASEDIPHVFGTQTEKPNYPQQQPNYPQQQPNYPQQQPNYPQQQPNYPQQQPNYPQQQPNYPQQQPNYPQQQPNYPNQPPVAPTTTTTTTTEEPRPVWPVAYPTTPKPPATVFTTVSPIWPVGDNGNKPGFTVSQATPKPTQVNPSDTSLDPLRPQLEFDKTSQNDPNDYGDIQIVMGKK